MALHVLGVIQLFGFETLTGDRPVVDVDYGLHYYRALRLRDSEGFPGLVWDPNYMGGYPLGGTTDVDNRLGEIGVFALRFLPPGAAWNWSLALLFSSVPSFLYIAARWTQADRSTATIAMFLAVSAFWTLRIGAWFGHITTCASDGLPGFVRNGSERSEGKCGERTSSNTRLKGRAQYHGGRDHGQKSGWGQKP